MCFNFAMPDTTGVDEVMVPLRAAKKDCPCVKCERASLSAAAMAASKLNMVDADIGT
jgi:hypothetical protein